MQRNLARRAPAAFRRALMILFSVLLPSFALLPTGVAAQSPADEAVPVTVAGGQQRVLVTLQPDAELSVADPLQRERALAGRAADLLRSLPASTQLLEQFSVQPTLLLSLEPSALKQLRFDPRVAALQPDLPEPPDLSHSTAEIAAPVLWNVGVDGSGQLLAVLDTGVERTHPLLSGQVAAELCFSTNYRPYQASSLCPGGGDFAAGSGSAADCGRLAYCGHGTHVAGIAAGRPLTVTVDGVARRLSGVAPGARLVAVKVFSRIDDAALCAPQAAPCALSFPSDQLRALQFLADNSAQYPVSAVNMSLGAGRFTTACDTDARKPAIDALRSLGVPVIVSAGNSGYLDALAAPACISSAIAVGANEATRIAVYSNRSAGLDLLAPGTAVLSAYQGGYAALSGTSMAAPHVTGAWALMRQIEPTVDVARGVQLLQRAARPLDGYARLQLGGLPGLLVPAAGSVAAAVELDGSLSLSWAALPAATATTLVVEALRDGQWQTLATLPTTATAYRSEAALPCDDALDVRVGTRHLTLPALRADTAALRVARAPLQLAAESISHGETLDGAVCGLPANQPFALQVNGTSIGAVTADADGSARFRLAPAEAAADGWYEVQVPLQRLRSGYRINGSVTALAAFDAADMPQLAVPAAVVPRDLTILVPFVGR